MTTQARYDLRALFLLVLLGTATAAEAQVQPELAKRYFEEVTKLCERDGVGCGGTSLCGPMVIVDQATGTRATSQPEPEEPQRIGGVVDGPFSWGGLRWFRFPLQRRPSASFGIDKFWIKIQMVTDCVRIADSACAHGCWNVPDRESSPIRVAPFSGFRFELQLGIGPPAHRGVSIRPSLGSHARARARDGHRQA